MSNLKEIIEELEEEKAKKVELMNQLEESKTKKFHEGEYNGLAVAIKKLEKSL
ncbi:hypothetical protein [Natranaerobius thermophilus]|uniref:Uncharacterized protein n=1 Tax=Natranaerobius thermophilus (strain ATCC BAA-1301 / DSM 18059 / JW/NM-WN-LF) TaxID=457570 RepID=B2A8Q2_NATTJ|nr:hypothetical protein [Natranaerobius thermophilus]ACB86501.1 hypothetical protein Nther_2956 [Natranaerobius thermophilus JW/NM-WN-LF]